LRRWAPDFFDYLEKHQARDSPAVVLRFDKNDEKP